MNTIIKDLKELEGKTIEHVLHDQDNTFTVRTTDGVDYDVVATGNSDNSGVFATLSFERLTNDADWTEEDTLLAEKEGWSIFYCEGSGDGLYQIQRIDDMYMWSDDRAVWAKLVLSDKPLHKKAIHYIRKANPQEYSKILGVYNDAEKYKKGIDQLIEHLKNASSFWENHSDEFYGSLDYDKIKHDTLWFCLSNDALTPTDEDVASHAYNLMELEHSKQEAEFKKKVDIRLSRLFTNMNPTHEVNTLPNNYDHILDSVAHYITKDGDMNYWSDGAKEIASDAEIELTQKSHTYTAFKKYLTNGGI